jgi:hypothetical protein
MLLYHYSHIDLKPQRRKYPIVSENKDGKKRVARNRANRERKTSHVPSHATMQRCEQKHRSPRNKRNRLLNNPEPPPTRRLSLHHKQTLTKTTYIPKDNGSSKKTRHENSHGILLQPRLESKSPKSVHPTSISVRLSSRKGEVPRWVHAIPEAEDGFHAFWQSPKHMEPQSSAFNTKHG